MSGGYANPKPCSAVLSSPIIPAFIRVYQAVRVVAWGIGRLLDFITTFFFSVVVPVVQYSMVFLAAFLNFMGGLLVGEIRVEFSILFPVIILIGSWILWALYPPIGCFIEETIIPLLRPWLEIIGRVFGLGITVYNILTMIWNALVPLVGIIIQVIIEIFVVFWSLVVAIIGDGEIMRLLDAVFAIIVQLANIIVEVVEAITSMAPTLISVFVTIIGLCITIIIEAAPILVQITSWLLKILYFALAPILKYVIKVVKWFIKIRNAQAAKIGGGFFKRSDVPGETAYDENMEDVRRMVDYEEITMGAFFDALSDYFTEESAGLLADSAVEINDFSLTHKTGYGTYYHYVRGPNLAEPVDLERFEATEKDSALESDGDGDSDDSNSPYDEEGALGYDAEHGIGIEHHTRDLRSPAYTKHVEHHAKFDEHTASLAELQSHAAHPLTDLTKMKFASDKEHHARVVSGRAHRNADGTLNAKKDRMTHHIPKILPHHIPRTRLTDKPLHDDFHQKVECKSKFCGGHGRILDHPILTTRRLKDVRGQLFGLADQDHDTHRARFITTHALITASRIAMTHTVRRHYVNGGGHFTRRAGEAFATITGYQSFHSAVEETLKIHEHPIDSLLSLMPVPGEFFPFNMMNRAWDEHPETLWGNWIRERVVFRQYNATADPIADFSAPGDDGIADDMSPAFMPEPADSRRRNSRRLMHVTLNTRAELEKIQSSTGRHLFEHEHEQRSISLDSITGASQFVINEASPVAAADRVQDNNLVPTLPVFHFVSQSDCVHRAGDRSPRNPLCLPEIPVQVTCVVSRLLLKAYDKVFVDFQFCDYEPQCADLGFYIIKRPEASLDLLIVVDHFELFISWPWIFNGFLAVVLPFAFALPVAKAILGVAAVQAPYLYLIFNPIQRLIPEVIVLNDLLCPAIFFYGIVLDVVLAILFKVLLYPFLLWFFRLFTSTEAMIGAFVGIESAMLARIESSDWWQSQNAAFTTNPRALLRNDPFIINPPRKTTTKDPADSLPSVEEVANPFHGPGADRGVTTVRGDIESGRRHAGAPLLVAAERGETASAPPVRDPNLITPEARRAMVLYARCVDQTMDYFGEPDESDTFRSANDFRRRLRPLIHTAHFSYSWVSRWVGQIEHQRRAARERRPAEMGHWDGPLEHEEHD